MTEIQPHPFEVFDGATGHTCTAMVMRDGGGDQCGLPPEHPQHKQAAEVEVRRLRRELASAFAAMSLGEGEIAEALARGDEARAEVERMREGIRRLIRIGGHSGHSIALVNRYWLNDLRVLLDPPERLPHKQ